MQPVKHNPNKELNELMIRTKQPGHINMSNTAKRLLASVPREQRAVWKRLMLAAQRKATEFKHNMTFKNVPTADGGRAVLAVDSRYLNKH